MPEKAFAKLRHKSIDVSSSSAPDDGSGTRVRGHRCVHKRGLAQRAGRTWVRRRIQEVEI